MGVPQKTIKKKRKHKIQWNFKQKTMKIQKKLKYKILVSEKQGGENKEGVSTVNP